MNHDNNIAPPYMIDFIWHAHQMNPILYRKDCMEMFDGMELYHHPWPNGLSQSTPISKEFQCAWKQLYGTSIEQDWKLYVPDTSEEEEEGEENDGQRGIVVVRFGRIILRMKPFLKESRQEGGYTCRQSWMLLIYLLPCPTYSMSPPLAKQSPPCGQNYYKGKSPLMPRGDMIFFVSFHKHFLWRTHFPGSFIRSCPAWPFCTSHHIVISHPFLFFCYDPFSFGADY